MTFTRAIVNRVNYFLINMRHCNLAIVHDRVNQRPMVPISRYFHFLTSNYTSNAKHKMKVMRVNPVQVSRVLFRDNCVGTFEILSTGSLSTPSNNSSPFGKDINRVTFHCVRELIHSNLVRAAFFSDFDRENDRVFCFLGIDIPNVTKHYKVSLNGGYFVIFFNRLFLHVFHVKRYFISNGGRFVTYIIFKLVAMGTN